MWVCLRGYVGLLVFADVWIARDFSGGCEWCRVCVLVVCIWLIVAVRGLFVFGGAVRLGRFCCGFEFSLSVGVWAGVVLVCFDCVVMLDLIVVCLGGFGLLWFMWLR